MGYEVTLESGARYNADAFVCTVADDTALTAERRLLATHFITHSVELYFGLVLQPLEVVEHRVAERVVQTFLYQCLRQTGLRTAHPSQRST